jgi:hypothetical protein
MTPAIFSTVIPAKAGIQGPRGEGLAARPWIPAFAGMTEEGRAQDDLRKRMRDEPRKRKAARKSPYANSPPDAL